MQVELAARSLSAGRRLASCLSDDPRLVVRLLGWRLVLPVLKRTVSVATLARWMWAGPRAGMVRAERFAHVRAILERGGRVLSSENCLERSLLLYRLFSEAGVPVSLVMGTRYRAGRIDGHVWVECDGLPFGEPDAGDYARIVTFGVQGRPDTGTP